MGRGERRAKDREAAKRGQSVSENSLRVVSDPMSDGTEKRTESPNETARRVYRAGGPPKRRRKTPRRGLDKPIKWREGHQ